MVKKKGTAPPPVPPRIFTAIRGSLGRVIRGREISDTEAVLERLAGRDIVVCGPILNANRNLARSIEAQAGPYLISAPHKDAGPYVLPHYQPDPRPPAGHTFYETEHRKAAINP